MFLLLQLQMLDVTSWRTVTLTPGVCTVRPMMSSSADVRLGIWGMAMTRVMRSPRLAAMSLTTAGDLLGACLTLLREAMTVTVTL